MKRFALIAVCLSTLSACQMALTSRPGNFTTDSKSPGELKADASENDFGTSGIGVKSFEQMYLTMQQVTGISIPSTVANNSPLFSIFDFYNKYKVSLPQTSSLSKLQGVHLNTIGNFAAEFCNNLVNKNNPATNMSNRSVFFQGTPFAQAAAASVVLSTIDQRNQLSEIYMTKFWGISAEDISASSDLMQSRDTIAQLATDILMNTSMNTDAARMALEATCTAALASGPVIFM